MMTKEKTLSNDIFKDRKEMWDTEKEMICNLKHHIKLAQQDLKDKFCCCIETEKKCSWCREIEDTFIKHFGAKLLEDGDDSIPERTKKVLSKSKLQLKKAKEALNRLRSRNA